MIRFEGGASDEHENGVGDHVGGDRKNCVDGDGDTDG